MPELPYSGSNWKINMDKVTMNRLDIQNSSSLPIALSPVAAALDDQIPLSKDHSEHLIQNLADIVESGRQFSDLSDPQTIRRICAEKIPHWNKFEIDEIKVSQIMAGLTNQLFRVHIDREVDATISKQVLFRVYGTTVGDLYDSKFELEVFKILSKNDSAPRLIAEFVGGRIEEYILGPALLVKDMTNPAVLCAMASILSKFHKLYRTVPEISKWIKNEPSTWRCLKRWRKKAWSLYLIAQGEASLKASSSLRDTTSTQNEGSDNQTDIEADIEVPKDEEYNSIKLTLSKNDDNCFLFDTIDGFTPRLESTENLLREKNSFAKDSFATRLKDTGIDLMYEEARNLKNLILPYKDVNKTAINGIAFCHNDVQENNILVTGSRLRIIDFEYADFNHPAFDIANFFCEMTIDYCHCGKVN